MQSYIPMCVYMIVYAPILYHVFKFLRNHTKWRKINDLAHIENIYGAFI